MRRTMPRLGLLSLPLCSALLAASPAFAQAAVDMVDTPVLARTVERGERLATADFIVKPLPGPIARRALPVADVTGKEAARRLVGGAPVRTGDVLQPQAIKRGDAVIIAVRTGSLSITTPGRALSGGATGGVVRVLNLATNRTLNAVIEDGGHVRVDIS
jgi:flagella basal body P-ring formation protein FlgA